MKESIAEQLFDQQASSMISSLSCADLSFKLDSIDREGATEKNEDNLQLKNTKDDANSSQSQKKYKSNSNSLENVNTKSQQPQATPTESDKKEKKFKKRTPPKNSLSSPGNKSFKKNIKRFGYKFYKLCEYTNFEDRIEPNPIAKFKKLRVNKKFERKIIFKKNNTVYIVIKKKRLENKKGFENDFLFNSLGNSNEGEEKPNFDEIAANINFNHSPQIYISDEVKDTLVHLTINCTD